MKAAGWDCSGSLWSWGAGGGWQVLEAEGLTAPWHDQGPCHETHKGCQWGLAPCSQAR